MMTNEEKVLWEILKVLKDIRGSINMILIMIGFAIGAFWP